MPEGGARPLTVLGIYPWNRFWSMGEGKGAPSFFLAPQALVKAGHSVHISMPRGKELEASPAFRRGGETSGTDKDAGPPGEASVPAGLEGVDRYHGMSLHRYRFAIDFMPITGGAIVLHLTRPFRYVYFLILAAIAGLRAARVCRPDVVVGYGAWAAPVAFLVARSLGLPNVTRLFGQSIPAKGGGGARAAVRIALNYTEIVAFLTSCSTLIVCDDGSGGDKVAERLGVPAGRLRFWKNGVDKKIFRSPVDRGEEKVSLGLDPNAPMLLSVSRLDAEKHHERLIHALPGLLESFPAATVFIIGEGPERPYLEAESSRLGVDSSLSMPGAMKQEELAAHYKACDVFMSLSDRTNVANPTLEAMCCGAPVVALAAGDTSETLHNGRDAVIIEKDDLPKLGEIVARLIEDDDKRDSLGRGAAEYASNHVPSIELRSRMEADAVFEATTLQRRSSH